MRRAIPWPLLVVVAGCRAPTPPRPAPSAEVAPVDTATRVLEGIDARGVFEGVTAETLAHLFRLEVEVAAVGTTTRTVLARRSGCAFHTEGHLVTARRLVRPEEYEPDLAVLARRRVHAGEALETRCRFTGVGDPSLVFAWPAPPVLSPVRGLDRGPERTEPEGRRDVATFRLRSALRPFERYGPPPPELTTDVASGTLVLALGADPAPVRCVALLELQLDGDPLQGGGGLGLAALLPALLVLGLVVRGLDVRRLVHVRRWIRLGRLVFPGELERELRGIDALRALSEEAAMELLQVVLECGDPLGLGRDVLGHGVERAVKRVALCEDTVALRREASQLGLERANA